jgi:hypothetical protein
MVEDQSRPQPMTGHLYRLANPSQRQAQSARRPHHRMRRPRPPHHTETLHSLPRTPFLSSVATMFATTRTAASMALRGSSPPPRQYLCPQLMFGRAAFLSSSSSDRASPAIIVGNPGTPPPMKAAIRREVPLPSQEGKKGAMQYALYVIRMQGRRAQRLMGAAPHSTKSPTGRVRAPSGP